VPTRSPVALTLRGTIMSTAAPNWFPGVKSVTSASWLQPVRDCHGAPGIEGSTSGASTAGSSSSLSLGSRGRFPQRPARAAVTAVNPCAKALAASDISSAWMPSQS